MNRVAVTGAAGFLGSALVKKLLSEGKEVYAFDVVKDPSFRLDLSNSRLHYVDGDIFDETFARANLFNKEIDTFYHFAWVGSAGPLREDYEVQIRNATGTVELMKLAKEAGFARFIVAGSIMEHESFEAIFAQGNKPHMAYIYGIGKQLAHSLCKPIANQIGIDLIWTNITNSFGVGELSPRLINQTIRKCIHGEALQFTSGTQHYDFIYIDDLAEAFYLVGKKGKPNKTYLIGSGKAGPLREFLEKLVYTCDKNAKPLFGDIPFTGTDLPLETFSIKEIQSDCGFTPRISFEEGVRRTYEWLKKEEEGK